jgi:transposase
MDSRPRSGSMLDTTTVCAIAEVCVKCFITEYFQARNSMEKYRWLSNHLLEKRKDTYEHTGKGLSLYQQQATFPMLKQEHPSLDAVHSQIFQNVAVRVDLAFKAFFRRCKSGDNPGYPRFKGKGRYDSFTFPQSGFALLDLLPQHMIGQPLLAPSVR